jgi:hypothetical protein
VNAAEVLRHTRHARDRMNTAIETLERVAPPGAHTELQHTVWGLIDASVAAGGIVRRLEAIAGELEAQLAVLRLGCIGARNAIEDLDGADRRSDALLEEAVGLLGDAASLLGAAGSAAAP